MNIDSVMVSEKDGTLVDKTNIGLPSVKLLFYLSIEFLIAIAISCFISILNLIKSVLPKPPRDLTGNVVLIVGAASSLGASLADEFAKRGCSVICVDEINDSVQQIASDLQFRYSDLKGDIRTSQEKQDASRRSPRIIAYQCNLLNHNNIHDIAKKVKNEIGGIDILVTCVGAAGQDIFDTANTTLMSHYWTILAFLPSMLNRERVHIVGVMPVVSNEDAYIGSRTAIANLMECLGRELSNCVNNFTFLAVAPTTKNRSIRQGEQRVAKDIVEAVRRDQSSLNIGWCSPLFYRISCVIYNIITTITRWYRT
ncbi:short-chain dehydrogenase/reductase family 16C member 6-like [Vespa mandarinia]|uniref:short-chain dehydrogenase/reductase family 16C member 6-like n=1 Tax=Vespa mandarinia TaxID=7446 RepID=UPI00161F0968|nr:short-chain dehydrogenase/reductase family 16C member 6-like [Vespa mandarinia]XP_035737955.1 short-chain dehydrogenase/reductase family 16C member 6-like [Vespa mandarinia]